MNQQSPLTNQEKALVESAIPAVQLDEATVQRAIETVRASRRVIYINVRDMTEHDVKQVREQLLQLGNEPVLVLRQRAWVAFLLGSLVGAIATWFVLTYA